MTEHLESGEGVRAFSRAILLAEGTTFANVTVVLTDRRLLIISDGSGGRDEVEEYPRDLCTIVKSRVRADGSILVGIRCAGLTTGLCFQSAWLEDAGPLLKTLGVDTAALLAERDTVAVG